MNALGPGSELRRLVFHYFDDHDGFLSYEEWTKFDEGMGFQLDPILQSQWIPQGYIQPNQPKGGYELTSIGEQELEKLNALKFCDTQDRSD